MKRHKLTTFLDKLKNGKYAKIRGARSALAATHDLTDTERKQALTAIELYFESIKKAPEPAQAHTAEPVAKPASRVPGLLLSFQAIDALRDPAIEELRAACDGEERMPYTDDELGMLLTLVVRHDAVAAFASLVYRYSLRIRPELLDMERFGRSPKFFSFANIILGARGGNQAMLRALLERMAVEIDRRASDPEQVSGFEMVVTTMGKRIDLKTFGPVIVEYASPAFVFEWLKNLEDAPEDAIHQFTHRVMSLYLNGDATAEMLLLLQELDISVQVTEEIIRCLLVQRQLGDAILVAKHAPEDQKAQLYQALHPVVQRHGDAIGLVTFASTFPRLCDRVEIKELVKRFFEPDPEKKIDALIDGIDPSDHFESIPSVMPPEIAAQLRDNLLGSMGHPPVRTPRTRGSMPPAVRDLLDRLGAQAVDG